jgi:hypothetical protein
VACDQACHDPVRASGAAAPLPVCCVDAALFARAGVTPSQGAGGAW